MNFFADVVCYVGLGHDATNVDEDVAVLVSVPSELRVFVTFKVFIAVNGAVG
jgi:hypothetical protein